MSIPGLQVTGLAWDGLDIQRLDVMITIDEGLDNLPVFRGNDQILPFRTGRLPGQQFADHRPIVASGWVAGSGALPRSSYRAYVDELKLHLDPRKGPRFMVATLADGSTRWITARADNLLPGEHIGDEFALFSIQWDACDPYWYGTWGTLAADSGLFADAGYYADSSADIVVVPTSPSHEISIDTLGTADVEWVRVTFKGPSVAPPGCLVTMPSGEQVGFTFSTALSGSGFGLAADVLIVANHQRLVLLNGTGKRNLLTLASGNEHGEYIRLGAGVNAVRILGQPSEARITFNPTYS